MIPLLLLFASQWLQFRGPNGSGVATGGEPPITLQKPAWKTAVPFGRSSPILIPQGIILTATEGDTLITLCLDRATGKVKWRREAKRQHRHAIYKMNDGASPTPVSDGRNVYVFFPDLGLISYTGDGQERWRLALGPFDSFYGMAGSPVLHNGTLFLVCDQRHGSFLIAVDTQTGKPRWRADRNAGGFEGFSTPLIHNSQLIVQGSFRVDAYSTATGEKLWWARRQGYNPKGVPVLIGDLLVLSSPGSDEPQYPAFDSVLPTYDKDGNGLLSREEVKANADMYEHYGAMDADRDGQVNRQEYDVIRNLGVGDYGMVAIRLSPSAKGDLTDTATVWRDKRSYPNVPAPLHFQGLLFSVRNGGIVTTHDPQTGKALHTARLTDALGDYYAAPVAANGHVYFASEQGVVTVIRAKAEWETASVNPIGDEIYATPAIEDNRLYLRTRNNLLCFLSVH
ncbi:MAG: PQQ-binding-like beta-propeller repeat protein [Bryobacteraceae bacterium]